MNNELKICEFEVEYSEMTGYSRYYSVNFKMNSETENKGFVSFKF